jgi:hypothetical protein
MKCLILLFFVFHLISSQVTIEWKACPNTEKEIKNNFQIPSPLSTSLETPNIDFSKYVTLFNTYTKEIQCAYPTVPVYWKNPNGKNITFSMRRIKANNRKGQFWINDGGPGGGGSWTNFGPIAIKLFDMFKQELDIIVPSHRGTGSSTPLSCPQESDPNWIKELEFPGKLFLECQKFIREKYGDSLDGFNPTEAVRDVYNVAESLRRTANEKIVIFGVSYGAYLVRNVIL